MIVAVGGAEETDGASLVDEYDTTPSLLFVPLFLQPTSQKHLAPP